MPITAARRTYSAIAVRRIPTERAITRSLTPQAYFRRRTSRIFRIGNLSAGIRPPIACTAKGGPCPVQMADNATRLTLSTGWPPSFGLGGRFRSESLAAFRRNRWPLCLGFRRYIAILADHEGWRALPAANNRRLLSD